MTMLIRGALAAVAAAALAGSAHAATFAVDVWTGAPGGVTSSTYADETNVPTAIASAKFTWTGPINWLVTSPQNQTPSGNYMSDFLGSSAPISGFSSTTYVDLNAFLNSSLSVAGDAYATFFRITTTYTSASPFNGSIHHDDGASIYVDGASIYYHPSETSEISAPYTLAAGHHSVVLDYVEGNGSPSVLTFDAPGGVPEPATWGLMLMGFGGAGAMLRARRRTAAA